MRNLAVQESSTTKPKYTVAFRAAHIPVPEYRYWLSRTLRPPVGMVLSPGRVLWIMLNPSTADGLKDDATIRRCMGFTFRWGFAEMMVVNLFAYRSTDPKALRSVSNVVGPENDEWITKMARGAERIVAAWGAPGALYDRAATVTGLVRGLGRTLWCLGKTKNGAPKHPVRLSGSTVLVEV